MVGNTHWSAEEEQKLEKLYPKNKNSELAEEFEKRTQKAIQRKAQNMGLEKNHEEIIKENASKLNVPDTSKPIASFIAGLTAGEGCFTNKSENSYQFKLGMASREKEMLEDIKDYLGIGKIYEYGPRENGWQDIAIYQVQNKTEIIGVLIPFFDEVGLRNSYKSKQYQEWRQKVTESVKT